MRENLDELVKQQERSGMKPTEFCRAHGIDPSKFGYQRWRRKGAQRKERFVRVDSGAVTQVEIIVREGVTIRAPLSVMRVPQLYSTDLSRRSLKGEGGCASSPFAQGYGGQVAFIQDEHSIKDIMEAQGIPDFFIRRSLGEVGQAPPPIPKFIDTVQAIDELPS